MSAVHTLNPRAEHVRRGQALEVNVTAAEGIMSILKPNYGPTGSCKMLVSASGDIKITKDGAVLLEELPIAHPTVSLIARTATAQDDITGDGTTTTILLIGELLRQARRWLSEDVHPRVIADGFELARDHIIDWLQEYKINPLEGLDKESPEYRKVLVDVAYSSLCTKVHHKLAEALAEVVVDAVTIVDRASSEKGGVLDLHMVEIMMMMQHSDMDTQLLRGIVMDHGSRQDEMTCLKLKNCHILTLNVGLEYEKSEVNSSNFYKNAEERAKLAASERSIVDKKVDKIIALKKRVCKPNENFVVLNEKGIDGIALDALAANGIFALRRVKRRNMERLTLCAGGNAICSLEDAEELTEADLGWADSVTEELLGEEKFTFLEGVKDPKSCTIVIRGPNKHTVVQIKDAIRDGLRAVKNIIVDRFVVPGAGAFEVAAAEELEKFKKSGKIDVQGKVKLGIQAFADALLTVPKTIAKNSGFDPQESFIKMQEVAQKQIAAGERATTGFNFKTGEPCDALKEGILDNYRVKHQLIHSATVIATQLLLVDEILKAGRSLRSGDAEQEPQD